ncbi:ATP-binding cassette domain-containing protein [Parafilimonas sp.]|uniref:ATP-binding cassette domain-containing protein n=1 Tax=Parafilimonas sp. TaxID=1969739 RepID=UPI0039E5C35B
MKDLSELPVDIEETKNIHMKISTSGIQFAYSGFVSFSYPALQCGSREVLLITGKSGCGKTTFLHILCGLIRNYKGRVNINDVDITALSNRRLDKFRGNQLGIIFQRNYFISSLNVEDNILFSSYLPSGRKNKAKAHALAEELHIKKLLRKMPAQLSQGEQQRVSIARALMNDVSVVLADEPTSSLDDDNAITVASLLQKQAGQAGAALIIVTHDERLKNIFPNSISLS